MTVLGSSPSVLLPSHPEQRDAFPAINTARLSWWRSHSADAFSKGDAERIRVSLRACPMGADPRWEHAVEGNVAAAVGIAIRVVWRCEPLGVSSDAALSALLACAVEGDATAVFLLSAALDRRAKTCPECIRLADSWLLASVKSPPTAPNE
jgi:hypothetical protein